MWSSKAKEFTPQIKSLRYEIKSCNRIRKRSIEKDIEKSVMKKILLVQNELIDYLLKYQKEVDDLYEKLVKEYKIKWNVTEELKQKDQMKWVQMMNNINNCVDEIINKGMIKY